MSHHFSEVFSELVPAGEGKLIMRTTGDEATGGEELEGTDSSASSGPGSESGSRGRAVSLSVFHGVQVRVTFSATGQQFDMQQLSGGQKALVALALIFAIQRCDPAPFYLFDEIDQALDANYRAGVARLIQKQVDSVDAPAQFITTTFRPELVEVASKCYGIALISKVSNIYPLDKRDAQDFVTNLMNEEEAVGQVTSVPAFSRVNRQSDDPDAVDGPPSSRSTAAAGGGAGGGGGAVKVGRRRTRDPTEDDLQNEEDEDEDGEEEEDDDDANGGPDDVSLNDLQDVNDGGELSQSKGQVKKKIGVGASDRGRGRGKGASSTSVGVGSGRVKRGSSMNDDEEDDEDEEEEEGSVDVDADADIFGDPPLLPTRPSRAVKSKGYVHTNTLSYRIVSYRIVSYRIVFKLLQEPVHFISLQH